VVDGESGLLAEPGDLEGLLRCLLKLAADPDRARHMGQVGRRRFLERYTWDAVGDRMVEEITARLPA
jgi:phosphatidylinositol alpha-1,6-mannosyltransferase